MANTVEELKTQYPELTKQLITEASNAESEKSLGAARAEQKRIMEIDEISHLFDAETVKEAKYGEKVCTAQEMTFKAAQKAAQQGKEFLKNVREEAKAGQDVSAANCGSEDLENNNAKLTPEQRMAAGREGAREIKEGKNG